MEKYQNSNCPKFMICLWQSRNSSYLVTFIFILKLRKKVTFRVEIYCIAPILAWRNTPFSKQGIKLSEIQQKIDGSPKMNPRHKKQRKCSGTQFFFVCASCYDPDLDFQPHSASVLHVLWKKIVNIVPVTCLLHENKGSIFALKIT